MRATSISLASILVCLGTASGAEAHGPLVNYQLQCMGCHLRDGSGEAGRVPSLRETLALLCVAPEGRRFMIQIPGVAQSPLSDADTAILLNWMVRNLADAPMAHNFIEFTADEVARYRGAPLTVVRSLRERLLRPQ